MEIQLVNGCLALNHHSPLTPDIDHPLSALRVILFERIASRSVDAAEYASYLRNGVILENKCLRHAFERDCELRLAWSTCHFGLFFDTKVIISTVLLGWKLLATVLDWR